MTVCRKCCRIGAVERLPRFFTRGMKMDDYDSEDVVLVIAGVYLALCVGRFLLYFLIAVL